MFLIGWLKVLISVTKWLYSGLVCWLWPYIHLDDSPIPRAVIIVMFQFSAMVKRATPIFRNNHLWTVYATIHVFSTWRFPEIGVPLVIIHFNWIFHYEPSSYWGTSIYGNPHVGNPWNGPMACGESSVFGSWRGAGEVSQPTSPLESRPIQIPCSQLRVCELENGWTWMNMAHKNIVIVQFTNLVGGWATPLKNMSSSIGMMTFPIYGKIKNGNQTTNQCCFYQRVACNFDFAG